DDVDGDPDRPRLVRDAALDRLADPPGRIGRELEAAAPVELLDRPDQADDSLLDQIEQVQLVTLVALRDRDDEPQVRVDHPLLRLMVASLDPLRELDLLLGCQQLPLPRFVQEQLEGVGRRDSEVAVHERRLGFRLSPGAVVGEFDVAGLELLVEMTELLLVELVLLDELAELGEVEAALLLPVLQQRCNLLVGHRSYFPPKLVRSIHSSEPCSATRRNRARSGTRAPRPTSAPAATSGRQTRGGAGSEAHSRP